MEVKEININDIKPYGKNAKKHDEKQIDNVAESIKRYGFIQPCVIDKNNVLVIGHCRFLAAKKLKLKTIPCVYVDTLTDDEVRQLRLLDNKLNESDWDFCLLAEDIDGLDFSGFDIDWELPKSNAYDDEEYVPEGYDEEMLKEYEDHSEEFLAKRRVMITYSPEDEGALCEYLGIDPEKDKLKVVYTFEELLEKKR